MSKRRSSTVDRTPPVRRAPPASVPAAPPVEAGLAPSRRLADAVVEACCLVAVAALPLYFTVLTNSGYEPDKAVLARVLAVVAAGAWVVGALADRRENGVPREGRLLLWLGLSFFLACGIATLLSIDPRLSFFGSQGRQQGLVTRVAYLIFFVCAATRLRQRRQIERLITVLLFGSIPVIAYGFAQQFGHDPIPSSGDISNLEWPVRSTFGQHVFLGSYLVMVIPFTAARLLENWRWKVDPPARDEGYETILASLVIAFSAAIFFAFVLIGFHRPTIFVLFPAGLAGYALLGILLHGLPDSAEMRRARLFGYAALLALQILTLMVTGARGPWLGALATVPVFGFLLAWWMRRPRIWQTVLAVSLVGGVFLFVLNIPNGPLQPLRTVHGLTRISNITESGGTEVGSVKGRLLIWKGVRTLLTTDPAVGNTWGGIGRDLVGYGPGTMPLAFDKVFPIKLRQATFEVWSWDRAHDIYMDYMIDAGLLALLSFLGALAVFFRRVLLLLRRVETPTAWILIAMASTIAGHLVDGIFGLEMAFTLTFFWLILGIGAGLGRSVPEAAPEVARPLQGARTVAWFWAAIVVLCLLLALQVQDAVPPHPEVLGAIWVASALAGVGAVALVLVDRRALQVSRPTGRRAAQRKGDAPSPRLPLLLPLIGVSLAVALVLASQMRFVTATFADRNGTTSYGMRQQQQAIAYLQQASRANGYEPLYALELGGVYSSLASSASSYSTNSGYRPSGNDARTIDPASALTLNRDQLFALSINAMRSARGLSPLQADLSANLGDTYRSWGQSRQAIDEYRQAERLSVNNPKYISDESIAWINAGQPAEAVRRATVATQLDQSYWFAHYALAQAYQSAGQHAAARAQAQLGLLWAPVALPKPPAAQLDALRTLERTG